LGGPGRQVTRLRHDLVGRPELTLDALGRVAAALDPSDIEQHAADIPVVHASGQVRRLRETFAEIVATEANEPWWVMLAGGLCRIEPYPTLAATAAASWRDRTAAGEGGVKESLVSVFVSSPDSMVPLHIDFPHNVLAQVSGTKSVMVGRVTEDVIERCVLSGVRNLPVHPETTETFVLGPGDGLYIPPCTPHSVVGLQGISISVSSMWITGWSDAERMARYWNARLRRLGLQPAAPSGGHRLDRAKASTAAWYGRRPGQRRRQRRS
jgi:hypothetical protein